MNKHNLPLRSALKMGLTIKNPVRFFFTILLAAFAFGMAGLALIAGFYNEDNAKVQTYVQFYDDFVLLPREAVGAMSFDSFKKTAQDVNHPYVAVAYVETHQQEYLMLDGDYERNNRVHIQGSSETIAYASDGYAEHLELICGSLPTSKTEILIPSCFAHYYVDGKVINSIEEIYGRELKLKVNDENVTLTVCGMYQNDKCSILRAFDNPDHTGNYETKACRTTRKSGAFYTGSIFVSEEMFEELSEEAGVTFGVFAGDHSASSGRSLVKFLNENTDRFYTDIFTAIESYRQEIQGVKETFVIASIVLCVFAVLLMYQFISVSIDTKKQMIGILRALGGKSSDVVKIFLIESGFLGVLSGVCAIGLSAGLIPAVNVIVTELFSDAVAIFTFNPWAFLIVFALSICAALLSALIPVLREAKRLPVDVIRFNAE